MRAIFTGTKQDLVECGFEKRDYGHIFQEDFKPDFIIISANNEIIIGNVADVNTICMCLCKTALSKLGDLIDKNLVRWE